MIISSSAMYELMVKIWNCYLTGHMAKWECENRQFLEKLKNEHLYKNCSGTPDIEISLVFLQMWSNMSKLIGGQKSVLYLTYFLSNKRLKVVWFFCVFNFQPFSEPCQEKRAQDIPNLTIFTDSRGKVSPREWFSKLCYIYSWRYSCWKVLPETRLLKLK